MKSSLVKIIAIMATVIVMTFTTSTVLIAAGDNHVHSFTESTVYSYTVVNPVRHTVIISTMFTCSCGMTYTEYETSYTEPHNFGVGRRTGKQYHHASAGLHYYEMEASCLQCGYTHTYWISVPCDGSGDEIGCPVLLGLNT